MPRLARPAAAVAEHPSPVAAAASRPPGSTSAAMRRSNVAPAASRLRADSLALAALFALLLAACDQGARRTGLGGVTAAGPWPASWPYAADTEPVVADSGMVVSTDAYASQVGVDVLREGGNAVDAAVAVSFALAVVNPEAGNVGGGGFMVAYVGDSAAALDYREKAPLAATRDMYLDAAGEPTDRSLVGHLAAGVPGTVMGMWEAHRRFGSLPWARLVEPAIALARGFEVGERFLRSLDPEMVAALSAFPTSAAQFLPRDGRPPALGDTLRQPDLARTLERIRDAGPDGFYAGETADLIVAEMVRGGGLITHEDLAAYTAVWRAPVAFDYRGHRVLSMPPPSSGGVTMAEAAHVVEGFDLRGMPFDGPDRIHVLAEAWRRAYADRNHYLADPDLVPMPLDVLLDPRYGAFLRTTIRPDSATASERVRPSVEAYLDAGTLEPSTGAAPEGENTTHFSVVDARGNAVAVTTTINSWYGSKVTVEGAGFVLNNEMDDFTAKPGTPNQFGLVQGENNAVAPGKRMLSAMAPAVVLDPDGRLLLVTGTPGGSTIITTVFQTISNVVDYGMDVSQAVLAPRVHHQHLPDQIFVEPGGFSPGTLAALEAMGHTVVERGGMSGDVQAILVGSDGRFYGQSDPRRGGAAAGW